MPSTYSTNLALELIADGEKAATWGQITNTNLGTLLEQAISGYVTQSITDGADTTITIPNGATGVARNMYIELTGALTAARNLVVPANKKLYFIYNNTTGGYAVTVKVSGQTGVPVPPGAKLALVCNGTDVVHATTTAQPLGGRLTKSGSNLLLSPYNGATLLVNSVAYAIPDAGVTLAVGATLREGGTPAANTTYYIYAKYASGAMSLIASATGYSVQAATGVAVCSSDSTLTLVGMARTVTGPAWVDTSAQRYVLSYLNRRSIAFSVVQTSDCAVNSTTATLTFTGPAALNWGDEAVYVNLNGTGAMDNATYSGRSSIYVDGAADFNYGYATVQTTSKVPVSLSRCLTPAEGKHTYEHYTQTSSASGTYTVYAYTDVTGITRG